MRGSTLTWGVCFLGVVVATGAARAQPLAPAFPPEQELSVVDNNADPIWDIFRPRMAVGHTTGPGFGYQYGYTTLDSFWPILGNGSDRLLFADTRGLLSDDRLLWGNNLELGYRRYRPDLDRIFGVWTSWDLRNTPVATYNQISGGFETFGRVLDAHANGYAVTGPQYTQTGSYILNAPILTGHNILLPTVVNYESALSGADVEVGGRLPGLGRFGFRGYLGGYVFAANTFHGVAGGQARLLARLSNNLDMNLQVRNDNAFGTTVVLGGALRWGGLRPEFRDSEQDSVYNRMADPTERHVNVSVLNKSKVFHQPATNPATGQPIFIVFVNNQAPAGGDGSFQRP